MKAGERPPPCLDMALDMDICFRVFVIQGWMSDTVEWLSLCTRYVVPCDVGIYLIIKGICIGFVGDLL